MIRQWGLRFGYGDYMGLGLASHGSFCQIPSHHCNGLAGFRLSLLFGLCLCKGLISFRRDTRFVAMVTYSNVSFFGVD